PLSLLFPYPTLFRSPPEVSVLDDEDRVPLKRYRVSGEALLPRAERELGQARFRAGLGERPAGLLPDVMGLSHPELRSFVHDRPPPVFHRLTPELGARRRSPVGAHRGEKLVRLVAARTRLRHDPVQVPHQKLTAARLTTTTTAKSTVLKVPVQFTRSQRFTA